MRNIKDMFDLTGKTVVITGGAGHLGIGISEALAAFGAELYLLGHDAEKNQRERARLREKYEGLTCESIAFDLHDKNSVHGAVDAVMQSARKVDVLINNAAYGCVKPLHEYEEKEWLEGIDGTINGVFRMTREILPVMLDQGHEISSILPPCMEWLHRIWRYMVIVVKTILQTTAQGRLRSFSLRNILPVYMQKRAFAPIQFLQDLFRILEYRRMFNLFAHWKIKHQCNVSGHRRIFKESWFTLPRMQADIRTVKILPWTEDGHRGKKDRYYCTGAYRIIPPA